MNPSLFGSNISALTGDVLLSFDVASVPHTVRGRAVNSSGVAVQRPDQLLAPEIGEGVGQLGSCPEDQVMKEPREYLLEGISFVLLAIILLVKGPWVTGKDASLSTAGGETGATAQFAVLCRIKL